MEPAIKLKDIKKTFHVGIQDLEILKGITFDVDEGDFVIIIGPSGCGKSTLLHTILGLEGPTSGVIEVLGENIYDNKDEDYRSVFRKKHIGMIYQQPNWIKALSVVENVAFPLSLLGIRKDLALVKAWEILSQIGMKNWANHGPTELSSGQQQKVALARALISDAKIIVADEPTGNLDYTSGQDLMKLMMDLNSKGKTIIMVTHDLEYLKYSKTAVRMLDGKVEGIYRGEEKTNLESNVRLKRGGNEESQSNEPKIDLDVPSVPEVPVAASTPDSQPEPQPQPESQPAPAPTPTNNPPENVDTPVAVETIVNPETLTKPEVSATLEIPAKPEKPVAKEKNKKIRMFKKK